MLPRMAGRRLLLASACALPTGYLLRTAHCAGKDETESKYNLPESEMIYTRLGGTGLIVSKLSFGFWATFGSVT